MWRNFIKNRHVLPVFLRIVKQAVEIHIIHQRYSDHCGQSREAPFPLQPPLHHHQYQVRNQCHPNLYLYGIGAFAIELFQWKFCWICLKSNSISHRWREMAIMSSGAESMSLVSNDMSLCFLVSAY